MAIKTGKTSRNNLVAGVFVVVCVLLAMVVIIVMSNIGERLKPVNAYTVRFSVQDGAEGLDRGAAVKLGGQRIGRVTKVAFVEHAATGEPEFVDVEIQVPKNLKLFTDADVQLIRPLLGTGSSLNIVSLSNGAAALAGAPTPGDQGPARPMEPGETIPGRLGAPGFLAPQDYAKFQNILTRVDRITAAAEPRLDGIISDAEASMKSVRRIADAAGKDYEVWGPKITDVLDRVRNASAEFEPIAQKVGDGVDEFNKRILEAKLILDEARAMIDANRPKIDAALTSVQELTHKANTEGYEQVRSALDKANSGLDHFASVARQADELVAEKSPQLSALVADAALAANQLKLTTVEIRAAPWRLLYQPSKKELENELLYNSVRQYSASVAELRQAADALDALSKRQNVDRATLDRLSEQLRQSFEAYQTQEREFMQRWLKTEQK